MSYLVPQLPQSYNTTIRRFEPRFWEVDFNIEATATVVTTGANSIRMKALLRTNVCIIGLYWRGRDKWDHPLFSYEPKSDWRNCVLTFDLTYTNAPVINDTTRPPVITVTDLSGQPYYVYLKNFMTAGSPASRTGSFSINFSTAKAGVLADQTVPWDFIDSIFIGFVSPSYVAGATMAPITELSIQADITNISVSGTNSTHGFNNAGLTAHELIMADGYADSYPLTPERVVEQVTKLGYRNKMVLYVGFTQWVSLSWDSGVGYLQIDTTKPKVNVPSQQWVSDYASRLLANSMTLTMSVSFELLTMFMPNAWGQKDYAGRISKSGWTPSSSLVTPSNTTAYQYLKDVAVAFVGLGVTAGATTHYQVGEPWWWPGGYDSNGPCFYDSYAQAEYTAATSQPVPTPFLKTIYDDYSSTAQTNYLTWLRNKLGDATLGIRDAVKASYPGTPCTVLFYTPTVSNPASPMVNLVDFPQSKWASPAWNYVEVEDYEVIEFRNFLQQESDLDVPVKDLGYALANCEYFCGFNLLPNTTFIWDAIDKAIWVALQKKGYPRALVWARPQICRDGWVFNHDQWATYAANTPAPIYPVLPSLSALGWNVTRTPSFNTLVSRHASGKEVRSPQAVFPRWEYQLTFEGLKSDSTATFQQMFSFFQSMKGRGNKFIYSDPESNQERGQFLGVGDGYNRVFTLVRSVGAYYEEPVGFPGAVTAVYANGVAQSSSLWSVSYNQQYPSILFTNSPAAGVTITADFTYYFVCRFSDDTQSFEEFAKNFHNLRTLTFRTVKP